MKKLFLLLPLLFCFLQGTSRGKPADSIGNYYANKYAAELAIVDSNLPRALSLYEKAFSCKRPHEKDLYNAFIVSCYLKDSLHAKTYFDQLAYLGLTRWSITDDLRQDGLDTFFMQKISMDYGKIHAESKAADFIKHAQVMDSFYAFDQGIRQYATNTYGQIEGLKKFNDSIVTTDSINIRRMLQYVQENGFPDIYQTGFYAGNYIHISSYPMFFLLLRHIRAMPYTRINKSEIMTVAKRAVLSGQFDPRDYAFVYDESEGTNKYGMILKTSLFEDKLGYEPLEPAKLREINQARKAIYLEPMDEYIRKLEFMRRCYHFHFFNIFLMMYNQALYHAPDSVQR